MKQILFGDNTYEIDQYLQDRVATFKEENGQDSVYDVDFSDSSGVADFAKATTERSLFDVSSERLVVLRGVFAKKDFYEKAGAFKSDDVRLIIVAAKPDKRTALFKAVKKSDGLKEFFVKKPYELEQWLQDLATERGGSLNPPVAKTLVDLVGSNQWMLASELQKVLLSDPSPTPELIKELVRSNFRATIFDLLDSVIAKNNKRVFELLNGILNSGESEMYIVSMLVWQFDNLLNIKLFISESDVEIAKKCKMAPFVVRKGRRQAQLISKSQFKDIFDLLANLEMQQKSTVVDRRAVLYVEVYKLIAIL